MSAVSLFKSLCLLWINILKSQFFLLQDTYLSDESNNKYNVWKSICEQFWNRIMFK